jgi:predicted DNA-binding protein
MNAANQNCAYLSFRLPKEMRIKIDSYCNAQDQTKSQFFRKLLKNSPISEIQIPDQPEQQSGWSVNSR